MTNSRLPKGGFPFVTKFVVIQTTNHICTHFAIGLKCCFVLRIFVGATSIHIMIEADGVFYLKICI
jgi:hypothetical protein